MLFYGFGVRVGWFIEGALLGLFSAGVYNPAVYLPRFFIIIRMCGPEACFLLCLSDF